MEITKNTKSYNDRRYGKPWIARVDFNASAKGEFAWGNWTGQNGGEGVLSINAHAGDIIAIGQKDNRFHSYVRMDFLVVTENGELMSLGDKGAAYKYFLAHANAPAASAANPLEKISDADLIAEVVRRGLNIQQAAA
jgi:hypothetical protein